MSKPDPLLLAIQEILFRDWDPLSVRGHDLCRNEYDCYAVSIHQLLRADADAYKLAAHLGRMQRDNMGLTNIDVDRDRHIARQLPH